MFEYITFSIQTPTSSHLGVNIQSFKEFGFTFYSSYFLIRKTDTLLFSPLYSKLGTIDKNSYTEVRYLNFFMSVLGSCCEL